MKIKLVVDKGILENEIIIKCNQNDLEINKIINYIENLEKEKITFYKKETEYYIDLEEIIFFETSLNSISAHTINDEYNVKLKLYELEKQLPRNFIRISKSTIVNINKIYSIDKNITSSSTIKLNNTYKQIYASRRYYSALKERLKERK